jgi:hypothetical protein
MTEKEKEKYFEEIFGEDFNLKAHEQPENFLNRDRVKNALDKAWEVRDFEIELYWKRATYFWAFIATIFAGFFVFLGNKHLYYGTFLNRSSVLLLISSFGVIFSLAWVLVNLGSKFWQENWEGHIGNLEFEYYGHLYRRLSPKQLKKYHYSVSKVNALVSCFVLSIWSLIFIYCLLLVARSCKIICSMPPAYIFDILILVIAGLTILKFFKYARKKPECLMSKENK